MKARCDQRSFCDRRRSRESILFERARHATPRRLRTGRSWTRPHADPRSRTRSRTDGPHPPAARDRGEPRNAAKSTGPKTAQGKERSRRNGWKHRTGRRRASCRRRRQRRWRRPSAAWAGQVGPKGRGRAWLLVHQMAAADVRMRPTAPRRPKSALEKRHSRGQSAAGRRSRRHQIRPQGPGPEGRPRQHRAQPGGVGASAATGSSAARSSCDGGLRLGIRAGRTRTSRPQLRLLGHFPRPRRRRREGNPGAIRLWTLALRSSPRAGSRPGPTSDPSTVPERLGGRRCRCSSSSSAGEGSSGSKGLRDEACRRRSTSREAERTMTSKALMDAGKDAAGPAPVLSGRPARPAPGDQAVRGAHIRDRKREGRRCPDPAQVVTGARGPGGVVRPRSWTGGRPRPPSSSRRRTRDGPKPTRRPIGRRTENASQTIIRRSETSPPVDRFRSPRAHRSPILASIPSGPNGPDRGPEGPAKAPGSSPRGV